MKVTYATYNVEYGFGQGESQRHTSGPFKGNKWDAWEAIHADSEYWGDCRRFHFWTTDLPAWRFYSGTALTWLSTKLGNAGNRVQSDLAAKLFLATAERVFQWSLNVTKDRGLQRDSRSLPYNQDNR